MKFQFLNDTIVASEEILQNAILRVTSTGKGKNRERLIEEHKKLEYYGDKNQCIIHKYVVYNTRRQLDLKLDLKHRISIENLRVNQVFTENFLLCRVVTGL